MSPHYTEAHGNRHMSINQDTPIHASLRAHVPFRAYISCQAFIRWHEAEPLHPLHMLRLPSLLYSSCIMRYFLCYVTIALICHILLKPQAKLLNQMLVRKS